VKHTLTDFAESGVKAVTNLHNFIADLPEEAAADLQASLKPLRPCADREVIFRAGDDPDRLFQITSGEVALCNYSVDGQEIILTKFFPGDWFGDTGMLDGNPRINTAISVGETQLNQLSRADFHTLCDKHPSIQKQFSIMLSNHVRMLLNLLVDASLLRLPARIVRTIQRLLVSMGKQNDEGMDYIECSHEELARFVSASRQSTSVELKKLEQQGIIRSAYGKIYILDKPALHQSSDDLTSFEPIAAVYTDGDD
jgi:CRP/FNR family cyclic AMP-dependent transcriptional regulator